MKKLNPIINKILHIFNFFFFVINVLKMNEEKKKVVVTPNEDEKKEGCDREEGKGPESASCVAMENVKMGKFVEMK